MYTGYVTFPRVFPVFWYVVSPLASTLWFWEVEMRGVNHQPIDDDSMGILKGYPSIHGYLVAKQDLNNFVWAITIASRKGYLSPIPSSSSSLYI